MTGRRSLALMLLGVALLIAGLVAGYVKLELAKPEPFADRAVEALRSQPVRTAIAEQVAVEMLERGSPDLVASRPVVLTAVEAVLETDQFERVLRRSARAAHEVLLRGDRDVIVELEETRELLVPAVRSVSPEVAEHIPARLRPRIAEIRGSDAATWVVRAADGASAAALPLLLAAGAALALGVALAPDRIRAVTTAGLLLTAGAATALFALLALRAQVVSHAEQIGVLSSDDARAAAAASWDALAGDLERWFWAMGGAGLALAAGAVLSATRFDRAAALRRALEIVVGGSPPRAVRLLRGAALAALGALILLGAEPALAIATLLAGGMLVLLGVADAASAARRHVRARSRGVRWRRPVRLVVVSAVLAAVGVGVFLVARKAPPAPPERAEITACNGLRALCDRRLDEVALPGTHNSMAAADRPGWFFANQIRPIPRQLRDGIRLLMIDAHYAVVDARGRVRTDLRAEGSDRNRVAAELGVDAVAAAERLAGRLGLVPARGERQIFLCHTLCELGAEPIGSTLDEIRGFLERNPAEVLVVFVESSVAPRALEREVSEADLEPYLATLRRGRPLPTLRDMVASGRRLVLLDEGDGGETPWFHAGFVFVQDTRISSLLSSRTACEPNRGTPDSRLLLMNHWIDRFPPPLGENQRASDRRTLQRRLRSCRARLGRQPTLIAVDFYERSDVIATTRELNRSTAAIRAAR